MQDEHQNESTNQVTKIEDQTHKHFKEGEEAPPRGIELMATIRWMILIAFSALAFFMVARELGLGSGASSKYEKNHPKHFCPMHPQIVQDEPGKCPICSMDLVLMKKESMKDQASDSMPSDSQPTAMPEPSDSMSSDSQPMEGIPAPAPVLPGLTEVMLSPDRIQKIGLTTTTAVQHTFPNDLEVVGTITVDDSRLAEVHSRVEGFIEYIKPLRVGDSVKKGELLATIYSQEVDEAEREYLLMLSSSALSSHGGAELLEAARTKLKTLKISGAEISAIEKAGKPLPLAITAISSGVITEKNAVLGAAVMPEMALFKTVDLSVVFAIASIYERDLARVQVGQKVIVTGASLSGKSFEAKVSFVYPSIDEVSRTRKVRIELKNPGLALLPGMFIDVSVSLSPLEGVAIPRDALIETGKHRYVFIAHKDGRFTPTGVEVGTQDGDFVQITKGLSAGDSVVLSAGFLLDAESRLHGGSK